MLIFDALMIGIAVLFIIAGLCAGRKKPPPPPRSSEVPSSTNGTPPATKKKPMRMIDTRRTP